MNYPSYIEMPFKSAIKAFPLLFEQFPPKLLLEFLADDDYICRIDRYGHIEVGYSSDDWQIH